MRRARRSTGALLAGAAAAWAAAACHASPPTRQEPVATTAVVPELAAPRPAPPPAPPPPPPTPVRRDDNPPPPGWVDLAATIPHLRLDVRYHTPDNFTEAPLPGYGVPAAWLLDGPAAALAKVQADLVAQGLTLLVFDAYRPKRASEAMVAWAWRTGQGHLVTGGYIRPDSYHNRGMAIDLGLARLDDGAPVDMGSPFDDLSPASHTANATGDVLANRLTLKAAMERHGWKNYWREWWHYSYPPAGKPDLRNVPYACFEVPEHGWVAPSGWEKAGWQPPPSWKHGPCDHGSDPR